MPARETLGIVAFCVTPGRSASTAAVHSHGWTARDIWEAPACRSTVVHKPSPGGGPAREARRLPRLVQPRAPPQRPGAVHPGRHALRPHRRRACPTAGCSGRRLRCTPRALPARAPRRRTTARGGVDQPATSDARADPRRLNGCCAGVDAGGASVIAETSCLTLVDRFRSGCGSAASAREQQRRGEGRDSTETYAEPDRALVRATADTRATTSRDTGDRPGSGARAQLRSRFDAADGASHCLRNVRAHSGQRRDL